MVEKKTCEFYMSSFGCPIQWGRFVLVLGCHICAMLEKIANDLHMPLL
jgi:hypothetical protein